VISSHLRNELITELKEFKYEEKYAYTRFKKDILSKYMISVQMSKVKEYLTEVNHVPYSIRLNNEISDPKILSKLKNWLFGVYFVSMEYSDNGGLIGVNEISTFEIY
jgi:CRISPR-associated endonuclease/helicase Cas3